MRARYTKIRKERAHELLEKLVQGPNIADSFNEPKNGRECLDRYFNWVDTWVIGEVMDLIPELRGKERPKRMQCSICGMPAPNWSREHLKVHGWSGGKIDSETMKGHKVDEEVLFCRAHNGKEIASFIENLVKDPEDKR